jgi:hypothetical protein
VGARAHRQTGWVDKYPRQIIVSNWILIMVMTLALVLAYKANRDLVGCVNQYFQDSQAVQRARAEAAEKNDQAVEDMVQGVLKPGATPAEVRGALEKYLEARGQVEDERRKNPVPTPPDHC